MSLIEHLPPEIYSAILSHVSFPLLQTTTLAFSCALPRSPIPQYHVFQYVRLTHPEQIIQLYQRLRKDRNLITNIDAFSLETWTADADVVVNLMNLLSSGRIKELRMFVGPNFAPEHLEDIFEKPWHGLQFLSLRFRPYVQRATYYQFLKGAYFDSTLLALSRWSKGSCPLPSLSIIQDALDATIAPTGRFAQPLVFFRLDPFRTLSYSPLTSELEHFRLRIPSRQVARFIYSVANSFPALEFLDLSTCNVVESDVEAILGRFGKLKHLVLDGCSVVSQRSDLAEEERQNLWALLGKSMALAGVKLAKEREKKLKVWLEANVLRASMNALQVADAGPAAPPVPVQRRPRRGRRGLATATISLRESLPPDAEPLPGLPSRHTGPPVALSTQKIRILPPQPLLRTFATTAPGYHKTVKDKDTQHSSIRGQFERGWAEGVAQLSAIRGRLLRSWQGGMRVVAFRHHHLSTLYDEDNESGDGSSEERLCVLCFVLRVRARRGQRRDTSRDVGTLLDGTFGRMNCSMVVIEGVDNANSV
ncbi:unnamed protein product [Somion occarium]|uniref:F-box domain-containing protein n=1 Tax=Somion occarium TaxID=3059160 RepID=A0ABP1CH87_9APHY